MSAFENIVIGKSSIPSLIITVILMIAIPVISFLYWRKRHKKQTRRSWAYTISVSLRIIPFPGSLTVTRLPLSFTGSPWPAFLRSADDV